MISIESQKCGLVTLPVWLFIVLSCFSIHAQECDIFMSFSGFGEGGARTNNIFNGNVGDTGKVYIWVDDEVSIDTGMSLSIKPCGPGGGIVFTGATVFNPKISVAGTAIDSRWEMVEDVLAAECALLDAFSVTSGTGILPSQNGSGIFLDEGYDPSPGTEAFLFACISFEIVSEGQVELCCETGTIVNDGQAIDLDCCNALVQTDDPIVECRFGSDNILCDLDGDGQPTGDYVITGTFTNLQDIPGTHLFMPPGAVSPAGVKVCFGNGQQGMQLPTPLNNGDSYEAGSDTTNANAIVIKNAMPGDEVCFRMTLRGDNGIECCTLEVCFEMPPCDCLQVDRRFDEFSTVVCNPGGSVDFSYSFQLTNLFGQDVYHSFLGSLGDELFMPDYFDLVIADIGLPLSQGQSVQLKTTVTGAQPGEVVNFLIAIHNEDLSECCVRQHSVVAPVECTASPNRTDESLLLGDMNDDGVVDLTDVQPFVQALSSGGYLVNGDINQDGSFNLSDVAPFVDLLTGAP